MANHTQAEKRNRQRIKRQAHGRHFRATMRTYIKRFRTALEQKSREKAQTLLKEAIPLIDRCAQKGIVHKRQAARTISRLTRALNALQAS